ncbi:TPA: hypothetical protein DCW38_02025 [candidate division WOR-3 bacterium]|jgi:outer membrane lipoprotein-sorting protein|uniref:Outer membrane lipoprotein-sorting protein n=1 Tax=candidate division WOR-3 bacterium TaxID=2052148 RepID=A0A350H8S6_UNCW3|nr:hypothetical protein [candidate division WOR-3 bacterium]
MNKKGIAFHCLLIVLLFISIHAAKPTCIDYIGVRLAKIETMEGVYTKEVNTGKESVKSKITFYDDVKNNKKHLIVSDSKGSKNDIFIIKDTLFVIDKDNKTVYFMETGLYGEIGKKMFNINVFESLSILSQLKNNDSIISVIDKNKKLNVSFLSDTSNLIYSAVNVRFNSDSVPELIEMYDWNKKVIMQLHYTNYKDGLPRAIKTLSQMQGMVLEEKISINKLKINQPVADKYFDFTRKGFKMVSLEEAMKPFLE